MSRVCDMCGKDYNMAYKRILLRGHQNRTTKKKQYANLQTKRIEVTVGKGEKQTTQTQKIKLCTSCLRNYKKQQAA